MVASVPVPVLPSHAAARAPAMSCNPRAKARTAVLAGLGSDSLPFPIAWETKRNNQLLQPINIVQVKFDIDFTMCFSSCAGGDLMVECG